MPSLSSVPWLLVASHLLKVQAQTQAGVTTRYWDCCKPSCSWNGKAAFSRPVATCAKDGTTVQADTNLQSGCSSGGTAFTCSNNQPWSLTPDFSLGFAAAALLGGNEAAFCCACYEFTFTSQSIAGKKMVVQVTNTGYDLANNHFDIQIPGGGVGLFNGCSAQWNAPNNGWGQQYGGVSSRSECASLPTQLQPGCYWRFDWFQGASNPNVNFKRVKCPVELTSKTQCIRNDDANLPAYTLPGTTPSTSITWSTSADGIWAFKCDLFGQDLSNVRSAGSECSTKCKQTSGCTHYAWSSYNGGTCWMKKGARFKQDATVSSDPNAVCGINTNVFWNGDWASGCDWVGNDLSNAVVPGDQCSSKCAATSGCTHYTWTTYNGGTCWMKKGAQVKSNAIATFDSMMVCGLLLRGSGSNSVAWTSSADGVSGASCDLPGQDVKAVSQVTKGNCSKVCQTNVNCTHYSWNSYNKGTCRMKGGARFKQNAVAIVDPSAMCGIANKLVWNGDWASGCSFVGNIIATVKAPANQCASRCSGTTGCTKWSWTASNGGSCTLQRGPTMKGDAVPNFNQTTSCGLLLRGAAGSSISWMTSADGIWATGCDLWGQDLTSAQVPGSQCSAKCKQTAGCTHYAWTSYNGGTCWMKSGARFKQNAVSVADPSAVCGINNVVVWSGDSAVGCDFPAKDLSNAVVPKDQCAAKCASTSGCTHYTWTSYNSGTCWMKQSGASKSEAFATYDQTMACGISGSPNPTPSGRTISVKNNCQVPIWVVTGTNPNQTPLPDAGTVQLNAGASKVYTVPTTGWAGRFWPKFGCDSAGLNCVFGQSSGPCPSTGCHPPADTKVEFYMPATSKTESAWYDVSLVDGYSLPVKIVPTSNLGSMGGSCSQTTCNVQPADCPSNENSGLGDLRVIRNGQTVACLAPCKRWNYPSPWGLGQPETLPVGLAMCCPTPPVSPQQCSSGPVINTKFVNLIRSKCPSAYSYAYDDAAGLHQCPGQTGFEVTFCP